LSQAQSNLVFFLFALGLTNMDEFMKFQSLIRSEEEMGHANIDRTRISGQKAQRENKRKQNVCLGALSLIFFLNNKPRYGMLSHNAWECKRAMTKTLPRNRNPLNATGSDRNTKLKKKNCQFHKNASRVSEKWKWNYQIDWGSFRLLLCMLFLCYLS